MRTLALFLSVLFSLAVILTSVNDGMAMEMAHMPAHSMSDQSMADQDAAKSPLMDHSAHKAAMPGAGHSDMCGMILCGPFMPLALGASPRKQDLKPVTYLVSTDLVRSLNEDPSGKPPRL